ADDLDSHCQFGMIEAAQQPSRSVFPLESLGEKCAFERGVGGSNDVEISGNDRPARIELHGGAAHEDGARVSGLRDTLECPRQQFERLNELLPEFRHCTTVADVRTAAWSSVYVGRR